jgi:hypothetical protein
LAGAVKADFALKIIGRKAVRINAQQFEPGPLAARFGFQAGNPGLQRGVLGFGRLQGLAGVHVFTSEFLLAFVLGLGIFQLAARGGEFLPGFEVSLLLGDEFRVVAIPR